MPPAALYALSFARMAEWQTRRPQKPLSERACGFESRSGHADPLTRMCPWRPRCSGAPSIGQAGLTIATTTGADRYRLPPRDDAILTGITDLAPFANSR